MKDITEILEGVGLGENEARIYLAILNLGKAGITEVAKNSGVKRTTIYSYITPLLEKGFIKRSISGKRVFFSAESPENIVESFEKKRKAFLKKLPLLNGIYKEKSPNPHLEFYEGKAQVKEMYKKIYSVPGQVLAFFSPEGFNKTISEEFEKELFELARKNESFTKNLLKNDSYGRSHLKNEFTTYNSKLLPKEFELDVDINIVKNTVVMISYEPLQAVLIKNKPFADFQRNIFNYFWGIL